MALIHLTDTVGSGRKETTKHPGVCLAAMFALIVGSALAAHLVFNALV